MAKILFFSPHSFIWPHAYPEAILAESLKKSGHEVVYVTCGKILKKYCICRTTMGVINNFDEEKREKMCHQCIMRGDLIRQKFNLSGYGLVDFYEIGDEKTVESILSKIDRLNFMKLKLDGIDIGKKVAYELLLEHKKLTDNFSEDEYKKYINILRSSLLAHYAIKRLLIKVKPDYVISYNTLYSINSVCRNIAKKYNVQTYFLHAGINLSNRLSKLMVGKESTIVYIKGLVKRWKKISNLSCSSEMICEVTNHFLELLKGRNAFVYSSAKSNKIINIRDYFNIKKTQKILVATMSSYDERFAGEYVGELKKSKKILFSTQAEWIEALINWVREKKDYFLVIRVHPREFPNKRESVLSEHAALLMEKLKTLPNNVKVNWPDDNLSLYDLACEADVFLNAWSSVGQEMSLLGLPVVIYSKDLIFYPADLNYIGVTKKDYFSKITRAVKDGWQFDRVRKTFRWYSLMFSRSETTIGKNYDNSKLYKNKFVRLINAGFNKVFPLYQEKKDCRDRFRDLVQNRVIDKVFRNGLDMPFDAQEIMKSSSTDFDAENKKIKEQMVVLSNFISVG